MNLTIKQINLLKHIATHDVVIELLSKYHNGYVYQLYKKGLIYFDGKKLEITKDGMSTIKSYESMNPPLRKTSNELTDHVRNLLRVSKVRKIA